MRFLVFTPPFSGHANVLLAMTRQHPEIEFEFVVTGWANLSLDLGIPATCVNAWPLHQTDPALWTLPRVAETLAQCLRIAETRKPDVILYDFFSIEGYFAGKFHGIPTWCSIPALLDSFDDRSYIDAKLALPPNQEALERIQKLTDITVEPNAFEQISDSFYLPGDLDLIWSYPTVTPPSFASGRANTPRAFVGNPSTPGKRKATRRPVVLLSLGTVVMGNLWDQQEAVRTKLTALIARLAERWASSSFDVRFVTQGQHVLDAYPANWTVEDRIDQGTVLDETSVFVTHGGSNSFHEALLRDVPMVAVPFFGDQPIVAKRIEELGLGFDASIVVNVDTKEAANVLDDGLCPRIDQAIRRILHNPEQFKRAFLNSPQKAMPLGPLLEGRIPFAEGDLLYGTNPARVAYVEETKAHEDFHLLKFLPFSQLATRADALPRIVDIYHDAIRDPDAYEREIKSEFRPYADHIRTYHDFLEGERDITQMCLRGLDFFSHRYHIHFLLEVYDPAISIITTQEIQYILEYRMLFESRVTFYKKVARTWVPVRFKDVEALIARKSR